MLFASLPWEGGISHEKSRIAGKKKVNAFKDGFLILKEMISLFFY